MSFSKNADDLWPLVLTEGTCDMLSKGTQMKNDGLDSLVVRLVLPKSVDGVS